MIRDEVRIEAASAVGWAENALVVFRETGAQPPAALTKLLSLAKAVCAKPLDEVLAADNSLKDRVAFLEEHCAEVERLYGAAEKRVAELEVIASARGDLLRQGSDVLRELLRNFDDRDIKTLAEPVSHPGKGPDATPEESNTKPSGPNLPDARAVAPEASARIAAANASDASPSPASTVSSFPVVAGAADGFHERVHGKVLQHTDGRRIVLVQNDERWWSQVVVGEPPRAYSLGPLTGLLDETVFPTSEWSYLADTTAKLAYPKPSPTIRQDTAARTRDAGLPPLRTTWLQLKPQPGQAADGERFTPFRVDIYYDGPQLWEGKKPGSAHKQDFSKAIWREVEEPKAPEKKAEANGATNGTTRKPISAWNPNKAVLLDCLTKLTNTVPPGKRLVAYEGGVTFDQGLELVAKWKAARPDLALEDPASAFVHVAAKLIQGKAL